MKRKSIIRLTLLVTIFCLLTGVFFTALPPANGIPPLQPDEEMDLVQQGLITYTSPKNIANPKKEPCKIHHSTTYICASYYADGSLQFINYRCDDCDKDLFFTDYPGQASAQND